MPEPDHDRLHHEDELIEQLVAQRPPQPGLPGSGCSCGLAFEPCDLLGEVAGDQSGGGPFGVSRMVETTCLGTLIM